MPVHLCYAAVLTGPRPINRYLHAGEACIRASDGGRRAVSGSTLKAVFGATAEVSAEGRATVAHPNHIACVQLNITPPSRLIACGRRRIAHVSCPVTRSRCVYTILGRFSPQYGTTMAKVTCPVVNLGISAVDQVTVTGELMISRCLIPVWSRLITVGERLVAVGQSVAVAVAVAVAASGRRVDAALGLLIDRLLVHS